MQTTRRLLMRVELAVVVSICRRQQQSCEKAANQRAGQQKIRTSTDTGF